MAREFQFPNPPPKRLPSLDGLRAVSIGLVVAGHLAATCPEFPGKLRAVQHVLFANAELGVACFFVISGFLITHLLLEEMDTWGGISLYNFYVRRVTRIFPAFYAYLFFISALAAAGTVSVSRTELLSAALFAWNYVPSAHAWWLGHTWSLSVEEQFYILWPATLLALGRRKARRLALAIIVMEPLIRLLTYQLLPEFRARLNLMLHTRADTLMFGCLLALEKERWFRARLDFLRNPLFFLASGSYLLMVDPWLTFRFRGAYYLPFGFSLEGAVLALILVSLVRYPESSPGRVANWRPVVWLGLVSYSLYLWQQVFLTDLNHTVLGRTPFNIACALGVAALSYYWIELPGIALRKAFSRPRMAPPQELFAEAAAARLDN